MISRTLSTRAGAAILAGILAGCAANPQCGSEGCRKDAKINSDVQALFDAYPVLEAPNILTVQTANSVVFLNGMVATDLERYMAESVALQVPGVAMVVNGISVTEK